MDASCRILAIYLMFRCVIAANYTINPIVNNNFDIASYLVRNYCNSLGGSNDGMCTGKTSYVAGCVGPGTSGSDNGLPNYAYTVVTQSRTVKNKTCIDTGNGNGIYLLPDELVSFITIDDYQDFSLTITSSAPDPFDNYIGLYFINYISNLLEPVNVTFYTIGGVDHTASASGISVLQMYYRSDDNITDGLHSQTTYFDAYIRVHALHKLTVYSTIVILPG